LFILTAFLLKSYEKYAKIAVFSVRKGFAGQPNFNKKKKKNGGLGKLGNTQHVVMIYLMKKNLSLQKAGFRANITHT